MAKLIIPFRNLAKALTKSWPFHTRYLLFIISQYEELQGPFPYQNLAAGLCNGESVCFLWSRRQSLGLHVIRTNLTTSDPLRQYTHSRSSEYRSWHVGSQATSPVDRYCCGTVPVPHPSLYLLKRAKSSQRVRCFRRDSKTGLSAAPFCSIPWCHTSH